MEDSTAKLIVWAASVAEHFENTTGKACSTTHVINLHSQETGKLIAIGTDHEDAVIKAKFIVEDILGGKASEN